MGDVKAEDIKLKLGSEILTTHEDVIRLTEEKVLNQTIPWEGYHRANLILDREQDLIKRYDKKSSDVRNQLVSKVKSL